MDEKSIEITCPACGKESLLRRTPEYDGFKRTGEKLSCGLCGHVFADEAAVPFKEKKAPLVFSQDDRPAPVRVFSEDENARLCRYCVYYVVNPFVQRCSHLKKEIEATDTCDHFAPKETTNDKEQEEDCPPPAAP